MLRFLIVLFVLAAVIYLTTRAVERRLAAPTQPAQPARPVAPDDDPDFLLNLEREQRRRRRDDGAGDGVGEPDGSGQEPDSATD